MADHGLKVIRPADRKLDVASGAMVREAAISKALTGAEKIWVGYVELPPGMKSAPHHHGECESVIFVISGEAQFLTGTDSQTMQVARTGDFVWVPPHFVHIEANASQAEPVRMVVARSTQETLVFNLPS
jgi:uncharacterized RmlC-like cupin family protein